MSPLLKKLKALRNKRMSGIAIRPTAMDRSAVRIGIVCIMKNAELFLQEWLDFHLLAGVDHVLAYDNQSTDATRDILRAQPDHRVTVVPWDLELTDDWTGRSASRQLTAYAHAMTTFGSRFERLAFIDLDEYLVPAGHDSISDALDAIGDHSNISIPWLMFGHSGHESFPEGGVIVNFTRRADFPYATATKLLSFKCIVKPSRVTFLSVHRFHTTDMVDQTANTLGQVIHHRRRREAFNLSLSNLRLHHYYGMSKDQFRDKISRGSAHSETWDEYQKMTLAKIAELESATVEDLTAVQFRSRATAISR